MSFCLCKIPEPQHLVNSYFSAKFVCQILTIKLKHTSWIFFGNYTGFRNRSSVAEPEPVGAGTFWSEPEPV